VSATRRLGRRLLRRTPAPAPPSQPASPPPAPPPSAPEPEDRSHRESLIRLLANGQPLDRAFVTQVRALVGAKEHETVVAIGETLSSDPSTAELGRLAAGIAAARRGYRELAWERLHGLPRATWAAHAPAEYVRSGFAIAPDVVLREIRELVADDPPEVRAKSWHELLVAVWGRGEAELARTMFAIFERHAREDVPPWESAEMQRDWLRPWIAADPSSPSAPATGRRTFAVMDYGHPSATKASANIGDHIQTIAALGHLVRHRNVRLHGRDELIDLLEPFRDRTRPERRRSDVDADVEVITAHRDASIYEPIPEDTWALCFGWFMHSLFRMRHAFPLHRNLRPIFVSFHCNKRELLTPEAIGYLKRYGPVGCRDWTTVDLLLSVDVPAFFSGCLTMTLDTVFPDLEARPGPDAPVAYVDVPAPDGGVAFEHAGEEVRRRSFVENIHAALELLERYRHEHRAVVTSRLHCYLPARSLGIDVEFRPENRSNVRFDGLIDVSDAEFAAIRDGLLDKLERVLGAILAGRPEDDVYALWREITADEVAAAKRRHRPETRPAPDDLAIAERVEPLLTAAAAHGPPAQPEAVHCALVMQQDTTLGASVLIASLLERTSRPLHLWLLARDHAEGIEAELAARFPELSFTWVPTRHIARGLGTPAGARPDRMTVIRLMLPHVLPEVERVVVLPLPSVATGDVAELATMDLGGRALAAPPRPSAADTSGFGVIHAAATRLEEHDRTASALRRTAAARHAFDFDAFRGDVLVLDLAHLRRERFSAQALALVEQFGLDDVEALHLLFGPRHAVVPDRWAFVPTRMPRASAGLIHWADDVKPWQLPLTPYRDEWRRYAGRFPAG
jgi:lipopolysaccharide biosynthesis glycosyltransferase